MMPQESARRRAGVARHRKDHPHRAATGLLEKGDVSDWLDVDARDAGKLADVCFDAPLWTPDTAITEPQHNDDSRLIKSSAEFVAGFVPPDYVVVGLLQRRFLYSNTGQTGAGKTAVTLRLAASTAQ